MNETQEATNGKVLDYFVFMACHEGEWVGIQTVRDGVDLPGPELVTSRPMTDEEVGRLLRLSVHRAEAA